MTETSPTARIDTALARIDTALARIEHAIAVRDRSAAELQARHDALRGKVGEAIAALDALGARGG